MAGGSFGSRQFFFAATSGTATSEVKFLSMPKRRPPKTPKAKAPKGVNPGPKPELYDQISARSTVANMEASRRARDIAPAPPIRDRARRDRAFADLRFFLST